MPYTHIKPWTRPDSYIGATWHDYYSSGAGRSRDSGALEESNFDAMLKLLGGESETVIVVSENHWAVGWVEWIAIHESDETALQAADSAMERLSDYPVLDEDDCSEREWNRAADWWDSLSPREKVQQAMYARRKYHWLADKPVWPFGRLDYYELANRGDAISDCLCEMARE